MTPERIAEVVARWVRFYTRGLVEPIARRRVEEIEADVYEHVAHERGDGKGEWQIAFGIASRMVRGIPADVAWRGRQGRSARGRRLVFSAGFRIAVGIALILSLPLVAMQFTNAVAWSLSDFLVAGALLTVLGVALEVAVKTAGSIAAAIGIAAVGVAAAIFGKADDAPGLVLLGMLLIAGACAVGARRRKQSRQHGHSN